MSRLVIEEPEVIALEALHALAVGRPVDSNEVRDRQDDAEFMREHARRMTEQTIDIPSTYRVTFSIVIGHSLGPVRMLSMSTSTPGKVPSDEALWIVARRLGFVRGLDACFRGFEKLAGHGDAVSIIQSLAAVEETVDV